MERGTGIPCEVGREVERVTGRLCEVGRRWRGVLAYHVRWVGGGVGYWHTM